MSLKYFSILNPLCMCRHNTHFSFLSYIEKFLISPFIYVSLLFTHIYDTTIFPNILTTETIIQQPANVQQPTYNLKDRQFSCAFHTKRVNHMLWNWVGKLCECIHVGYDFVQYKCTFVVLANVMVENIWFGSGGTHKQFLTQF